MILPEKQEPLVVTGPDSPEIPTYLWRDDGGCEFPYEGLPDVMSHNMTSDHRVWSLVRIETGETIPIKISRVLYTKWNTGNLVPEQGPLNYSSKKHRAEVRARARAENAVRLDPGEEGVPNVNGSKPKGKGKGTDYAVYKGQFRPYVFDIDPVLMVLYDFVKLKHQQLGFEYKATFPEWLREVVVRFFAEHSDEMGMSHLFTEDELAMLNLGLQAGAVGQNMHRVP